MPLLDLLYQYDLKLLHYLNVDLAHPMMDPFWLFITQVHKNFYMKFILLPLLLLWAVYIYRWSVLKPLVGVVLAVALTDTICYRIIKANVNRARPFENQEISEWVRKVGQAHGPSFPSNHSGNCFAGAVILAWYFRHRRYYFYTFAVLVALSRPSLGVHYPSDALVGSFVGIIVAWLVITLLLNRVKWFRLYQSVSISDVDSSDWRLRSRRIEEP